MRLGNLSFMVAIVFAFLAPAVGAQVPELSVTDVTVAELAPATVPVVLTTNGAAVAAVSFSLDLDETCLTFDPADAVLGAPADFTLFVDYDAADADGEVDVSVADVEPPIATLSDGTVVTLTFGTCSVPLATTVPAAVAFSASPAASFGDPASQDLAGTTAGGTVTVRPEADLALAKLEANDPATSPLTYTLTVTNNGVSDSSGGEVSDVLPAGLSFDSSPDGCSQAGGTVTCPFGVLAAGAGVALAFTVTIDPSTPSPIVNLATVAGNEVDPNATNDSAVEVTSLDRVAPSVTAVASTADTGDGVLGECEEARVDVTELRLTFSEALFHVPPGTDPDDASNAANYLLVEAGADRDVTTFACGGTTGDDALAFDGVAYDVPGLTTSLGVGGGTPLTDGVYRLFACGNLRDYAGNPLDGGDFARTFRIETANDFVNGQLDCDLNGWTVSDPLDVVHDAVDVDGASVSGAARLSMSGPGSAWLGQCLTPPSNQVVISGWAMAMTRGPGISVSLSVGCEAFDQAGCGGASLGVVATSFALPADGSFAEASAEVWLPGSTVSAFCRYEVTEAGGLLFVAFLDDLAVVARPGIFADDFESGDTSAWSSTVP